MVATGHLGNQPTSGPIPQQAGTVHSLHIEAKAFSQFAIALNKIFKSPGGILYDISGFHF